jgi:hypothetical protein
VLADRALALATAGGQDDDTTQRLAGHLAELAWLAAPDDRAIAKIRRQVFAARADAATSTMARGIFRWAAGEADQAD